MKTKNELKTLESVKLDNVTGGAWNWGGQSNWGAQSSSWNNNSQWSAPAKSAQSWWK